MKPEHDQREIKREERDGIWWFDVKESELGGNTRNFSGKLDDEDGGECMNCFLLSFIGSLRTNAVNEPLWLRRRWLEYTKFFLCTDRPS